MTSLAVILSAFAAIFWGALEFLRRREHKKNTEVVERGIAQAFEQAEREKAQLTDPDKTPTPEEAANAFRAYRDADDGN